jgi:hypothetical protein
MTKPESGFCGVMSLEAEAYCAAINGAPLEAGKTRACGGLCLGSAMLTERRQPNGALTAVHVPAESGAEVTCPMELSHQAAVDAACEGDRLLSLLEQVRAGLQRL